MGLIIPKVFNCLFSKKSMRIVLVGLDGAGKTTILYKLQLGETLTTIPTTSHNLETVNYKNVSFLIWDSGGGDKIRNIWRHCFPNADGLIYVVDSTDCDRIEEARLELHSFLEEPDLKDYVLLVFANKQDLPNSMSTTEITDKLDLNTLKNRNWYVQAASATQGNGLYEGLDWLSNQLETITK